MTLFMTLLAAFELLLSRYSAQDDFVVGTPVAGRSTPEVEPLIGFFVNTLALRARLDHRQPFVSLIKQVQQTTLEAYAHQDLPFEQVVDALQVQREISYTPVFQVMFSVQNQSDVHVDLPQLKVTSLPLSRRTSKFDLNLTFSETSNGLAGELEYNTDLFLPATVLRMETQLRQLLINALAAPDVPLHQVSMMSDDEHQRLLCDWNPVLPVYSAPSGRYGLAALFEEQVNCRPDAPALLVGETFLSYHSLNQRANAAAQALVEAGVLPGQVVALSAARSTERVIALLAIVKAAAVYLPLELDLPPERVKRMLTQGQAQWAMVADEQRGLFETLPLTLLPMPSAESPLSPKHVANLNLPARPDDPVYIMFTSGSTGEPKGIVIPQRGIVRLVKDNGFLALGPEHCLLHYAPLSFDASTFEIWGALLNGSRLALPPAGVLELEQLAAELRNKAVNTLWLTAALFHAMAEHFPEGFAPLTTLLAGGDQLNPYLVKRVLYRYPNLTFINGYGPTENTTFTCCQVLTHADQVGRSVSIGKPIARTQVYVLNEALLPQALGVPGELCTAGDGVALGYLQAEGGQTTGADKFVANPFAHLPGHGPLLYRTGDKARYLADGSLEFLGRLDQQVKIRGYRIELGEIEASLTRLPWIQNAVVAVQTHAEQKYLVAYFEVDHYETLRESEQLALIQRTRKQLAQQLPDYMQPAAYKILALLPMTRNGKVDRAALPPVSFASATAADSIPRTPLEAELLCIWQAVLKIDDIGIHDNFFELGGHSLLATQVTSRIRKNLHYDMPVRQLFTFPTIAQSAQWLENQGQLKLTGEQIDIKARSADAVVPLTFAQRRLWLLEQLSPGSSAYLIPSALRIEGQLDIGLVNRVINALVARHESLRTAIVSDASAAEGVDLQQKILPSLSVQLAHEAYDGPLTPEAIRELIDAEASRPFDLTQAPLFRVRLLALDGQPQSCRDSLLLLTMHHIISDGWSMTVFIKEFTELYEAFQAGHDNPLLPLTVQYGDYALWQRRVDEKHQQKALDFWVAQLAENDPVLHLPSDLPRPSNPSSPGALLSHTLPLELSQAL
ncbi:MAG TPA: amino acid adenylation domain-containing protein, partial [Pseudomonadales bacterium]|nr:amino acid adenylation domain-containing protein [Pseudomonadales bacterium]